METRHDPPKKPEGRLARLVAQVLSEPVIGFFAIVAVALSLAPFFFDLTREQDLVLDGIEAAIVSLFVLEYCKSLLAAKDRRAFALSPWRLADLGIVVTFLLGVLAPQLESLQVGTFALRLLRVVLFGARLGGLAVQKPAVTTPPSRKEEARISVIHGNLPPRPATWEYVTQGLSRPPSDEWYHASGLERARVAEIARDSGISPTFLTALSETEYPRVEVYERFSALFTWIPSLPEGESAHIERNGVLLLATDYAILTVARHGIDLQQEVSSAVDDMALPRGGFALRTSLAILRFVLRRYEDVAGHLEQHARELELAPVRDSRPEFLERTFRLQRQVSALKSDLWRLKGILTAIAEGRLPFHGLSLAAAGADAPPEAAADARAASEYLKILVDEASYVYETVFNAREGLLALIDLHLNVVSFEMNKVMRVLAVVSAMGLIPTVVGGLLGMNLQSSPWPWTLGQVAYCVASGMILLLYVFFTWGWLR